MALSQKKTTVSVLRGLLGPYHGREDNFAKLVKKSVSWVKKTSAGIKPLSGETARLLAHATGINLDWLMNDDIKAPPTNSAGKPYSLKCFELRRAELESGDINLLSVFSLENVLSEIAGVGSAAGKHGKLLLFHWRYSEFVKQCREEFGFDKEASAAVLKEIDAVRLPCFTLSDGWRKKGSEEKRATFYKTPRDELDTLSRVMLQAGGG
jgi:hypothetical protein